MTRLKLRTTASRRLKLESDAEVLHFPEGGVFGRPQPAAAPRDTADAAREAESALDRMQARLDELHAHADEVYHLPTGAPGWPPAAA